VSAVILGVQEKAVFGQIDTDQRCGVHDDLPKAETARSAYADRAVWVRLTISLEARDLLQRKPEGVDVGTLAYG
jgi:hypothetical protein